MAIRHGCQLGIELAANWKPGGLQIEILALAGTSFVCFFNATSTFERGWSTNLATFVFAFGLSSFSLNRVDCPGKNSELRVPSEVRQPTQAPTGQRPMGRNPTNKGPSPSFARSLAARHGRLAWLTYVSNDAAPKARPKFG